MIAATTLDGPESPAEQLQSFPCLAVSEPAVDSDMAAWIEECNAIEGVNRESPWPCQAEVHTFLLSELLRLLLAIQYPLQDSSLA